MLDLLSLKLFKTCVAFTVLPVPEEFFAASKSIRISNSMHEASGLASLKFWGGQKFDFRRATVFYLGHHFSKHERLDMLKILGGWSPGYAYARSFCIISVKGRVRVLLGNWSETRAACRVILNAHLVLDAFYLRLFVAKLLQRRPSVWKVYLCEHSFQYQSSSKRCGPNE